MKRRLSLVALGLACSVFVAVPAAAADVHTDAADADYAEELQGFVPGASRLEGRIRAPCCLHQTGQTLDIHGSEIANALRREIRRRLRQGESPDAIEASLVVRYGAEILAVPTDSPLKGVAMFLSVGMVGAGVAGFFMLRRWRDRGRASAATKKGKAKDKEGQPGPEYEARLDAELKNLDE